MVHARSRFTLTSTTAARDLAKGFERSWSTHELLQQIPDATIGTSLHQFGQVNETYQHYGKSFIDTIHGLASGEHVSHRNYSFTEGGFLLTDELLLEQGLFPHDIKVALQHNDTSLVGSALAVRDQNWA